jgi:hypothetical protein
MVLVVVVAMVPLVPRLVTWLPTLPPWLYYQTTLLPFAQQLVQPMYLTSPSLQSQLLHQLLRQQQLLPLLPQLVGKLKLVFKCPLQMSFLFVGYPLLCFVQ